MIFKFKECIFFSFCFIDNYSFSSCVDWRVSPDSEDSSLTDSSLPINSSCSSSDENSGLLSYHKNEVSGDVYTTPVHSSGEESGFSNSDGWESDSSGPVRSYKTGKNKPRSCDKYDRAEKPSAVSSLFVDATQRNVSSARNTFSDDLSNDDNLYSHTRKYSRKNKKCSKTSSDNRIDLFNAKCPPKKHPNIVGHSDLLTAVQKFHNLFTNHFARSETRCNHLPELSMIPKALDNCYDEKNLGSLEVNRQEFCKESGKKRRFLKAKKSTAVQPSYVVEKLFVRPKGSPLNSFVEIASCQSFNTKTKVGHHQLQSSPFKCFETLSTSNMQRSLDAISGWTKPLPRSPVSDTECWALDPKISLTPVSNDRVRSLVVKAPSATQSCPSWRCFQVSSADGNQHGSFSAVASLTHDLDEILSAHNTSNTRQRSHTLTSQSSSVNKSESSRKLRPQAKYSGVKSPGVKSPGVKSPSVKINLGVKSSVVKSSGVKSSDLKSPSVKSSGVKSPGVKSLRSIRYLTPFESDQSSSTDDTDILQTDSEENKELSRNRTLKVKEHSTLQSCWNRDTSDDRLKSPNSTTSRKPGYHKGLKSPAVNTNNCASDQPSVPLKATPRRNSLRLSDISLELCQTSTLSEQTCSSRDLKNTGVITSPECGTSYKQKRVPRLGESTPRPINSPTKARTRAQDKLSGQQYKKRLCKRPDYYIENGTSQSCLYDNNECLSDYTSNVLRSDADDAQTTPTTPSDVHKRGPRQSKPETPQEEKRKGNHFDRFTSPVSSNDDSPRIKNSLKVKNTRRRNSLGFHPYGYSNRKQSPSLSSPLQALAILSPSLACDETLRRSSPGHKPKPRRSIESEIKSKKSSESQKKSAFDAFEKHAASDNSDVMQDCCPGNCTKKFCFDCAMDCS